jgi:hypothetical protein
MVGLRRQRVLAPSTMFVCATASALLGGVSFAQNKPVDLRLPSSPAGLKMRTVVTVAVAPEPAASVKAETLPATEPTPGRRTLSERLTFRLNAGVDLESAATSGTALRGGYALDGSYASSRPWIVGDAMLASKDVLLPSMNAYLLSSFAFDPSNSVNSALPAPTDANDQNLAIRAGYAEWGRDDRSNGLRKQLWLRGGRQFRQNGAASFAYFDGATLGWRSDSTQYAGYVGRRVALYVDAPHGITFGASLNKDFKRSRGWPVTVSLDYQGLAGFADDALRQVISARSEITLRKKGNVQLRARVVGNGSTIALGRVGGRLNYTISQSLLLVADLENRAGGDLAYDLAAPSAVDVVDVARRLGVGLSAPVDALTAGARIDVRRGLREYVAFVRAEIPRGEITHADRVGFVEGGAAVASSIGARTWANVQYMTRQRSLDSAANIAGGSFGNTAGTGISSLHEVALDAVWRGRDSKNGRKWRISGGGFYRVYSGQTAYAQFNNDGRGGARADAQFWWNRNLHFIFGGELAQASPTMQRELSTLTSVRLGAEATF